MRVAGKGERCMVFRLGLVYTSNGMFTILNFLIRNDIMHLEGCYPLRYVFPSVLPSENATGPLRVRSLLKSFHIFLTLQAVLRMLWPLQELTSKVVPYLYKPLLLSVGALYYSEVQNHLQDLLNADGCALTPEILM
jgi:hypothetical protein